MKFIGKTLGLFFGLACLIMSDGIYAMEPSKTSAEPITKISNLKEREVKLKKITVKGKTIRIGTSSDAVVAMLPPAAFMDQTIEGDAKAGMIINKNYYYGDRYFKLVFFRGDTGPYRVVDIYEKLFN